RVDQRRIEATDGHCLDGSRAIGGPDIEAAIRGLPTAGNHGLPFSLPRCRKVVVDAGMEEGMDSSSGDGLVYGELGLPLTRRDPELLMTHMGNCVVAGLQRRHCHPRDVARAHGETAAGKVRINDYFTWPHLYPTVRRLIGCIAGHATQNCSRCSPCGEIGRLNSDWGRNSPDSRLPCSTECNAFSRPTRLYLSII